MRHWRRISLLVPVAILSSLAVAFYFIAEAANDDAIMPNLWPLLLMLGAMSVVWLMVSPSSLLAYRLAVSLSVAGIGTRPLGVLGNYLVGFTRSGWAVWASACLCLPLAGLAAWWWAREVGPWRYRHEVGATVDGD